MSPFALRSAFASNIFLVAFSKNAFKTSIVKMKAKKFASEKMISKNSKLQNFEAIPKHINSS